MSESTAEASAEQLEGQAALERVASIARQLAEAEDLDATLQRTVDLSTEYLEHCDGATLMLIDRGDRVITPAFTSLDARRADAAQYDTGQGPCLTAMQQHETIVIEDLDTEQRWPQWRDEVSQLGWRSMVGLRLFLAQDTMGALNLYSRSTDGFPQASQLLAQVFASLAAVAMKAAITDAGRQRALQARDDIGQAKGILMEREKLSGQQAFERLRHLSNTNDTKVRDLARDIAETGEVPQ